MSEKDDDAIVAYGCLSCHRIFDVAVYHWGVGQCPIKHCPACAENVMYMGVMPYITENEKRYYLIGDNGAVTGPYDSEEDAQLRVWDWFEESQHGEEKEGHQEGEANSTCKSIKLIASNGEVLGKESGREGQK